MGCCIKTCLECGSFVKNRHFTFCSRGCYAEWRKKQPHKISTNKRYRDRKLIRWSKEVRKIANYVCEICGEPAIDSHHVVPVCVDASLKYDLDNGIALCLKCHRGQHLDLPDSFFKNRF